MNMRPLEDRVLIRLVVPVARSSGGILVPDTAQEKPMEGEAVAVGAGTRGEAGRLHPLDGKEPTIVKDSDILDVSEQPTRAKKAA